MISYMMPDASFVSQVAEAEKALKMKIRPANAYFKLNNHRLHSYLPREELHQFLVGTYGEYVIPPQCMSSKRSFGNLNSYCVMPVVPMALQGIY